MSVGLSDAPKKLSGDASSGLLDGLDEAVPATISATSKSVSLLSWFLGIVNPVVFRIMIFTHLCCESLAQTRI